MTAAELRALLARVPADMEVCVATAHTVDAHVTAIVGVLGVVRHPYAGRAPNWWSAPAHTRTPEHWRSAPADTRRDLTPAVALVLARASQPPGSASKNGATAALAANMLVVTWGGSEK